MGKVELVKQISEETHIRQEVVSIVIDKFIDISIEEIVNNKNFPLRGFFLLSPYKVKGGFVGINGEISPEQQRVRLKMSKNISTLYKLQNNEFSGSPYFVNRDNWKGALKWSLSRTKPQRNNKNNQVILETNNNVDYNPFLDDDDE